MCFLMFAAIAIFWAIAQAYRRRGMLPGFDDTLAGICSIVFAPI
jgi:hypothetical protein